MLKRNTKELLPITLHIKGQGEDKIKFNVTYHNRKKSEVEKQVEEENSDVADTILFLVSEWETEFPLSREGIADLDDEWPGTSLAILQGFHDARRMEKVKN